MLKKTKQYLWNMEQKNDKDAMSGIDLKSGDSSHDHVR